MNVMNFIECINNQMFEIQVISINIKCMNKPWNKETRKNKQAYLDIHEHASTINIFIFKLFSVLDIKRMKEQ